MGEVVRNVWCWLCVLRLDAAAWSEFLLGRRVIVVGCARSAWRCERCVGLLGLACDCSVLSAPGGSGYAVCSCRSSVSGGLVVGGWVVGCECWTGALVCSAWWEG